MKERTSVLIAIICARSRKFYQIIKIGHFGLVHVTVRDTPEHHLRRMKVNRPENLVFIAVAFTGKKCLKE